MVWNQAKGICEKASSGLFDDKTLYEQGRALALAGEYGKALALFDVIENKHDAHVLTMIGYATRQTPVSDTAPLARTLMNSSTSRRHDSVAASR